MAKKNIFQYTDREVEILYLAVQVLVQHGINHGVLETALNSDSLRAELRNNISKRLKLPEQEIQEYYEQNARFITDGRWDK